MKIKAQIGMVINLDKCIGCHTCSVTCKTTWTNREGTEYMWWNNVETKPGIGYPKQWENQKVYKGGWELKNGKLDLKGGGRINKLVNLFHNPDLPTIDEYYEPWNYEYEKLIDSPQKKYQPVARPVSSITGEYMELKWGPNWEDNLAGVHETGNSDPDMKDIEESVRLEFEKVFMMYLPRLCEHCLNPACVSSCPSGAMYKRDEDGIVLVDQYACRSWRYCVSGCPYKKVYYNWNTNKAEKCTLCFPRIENGQTTICSETCVGRVRYIGVVLYDADGVKKAASAESEESLYNNQLNIILDPNNPKVVEQARKDGVAEDWITAAQNSPVYRLAAEWEIALPLHPEYRTLPMVWYIPPLSPITNLVEGKGSDAGPEDIFPAIDKMRIPVKYLANLLSAGNTTVIRRVLRKMAVMRSYMRAQNLGLDFDPSLLEVNGFTEKSVEKMYRLLAIAKYKDRFVIPTAHRENVENLLREQGECGLDFSGGPGSCGIFDGRK